MALINLPRAALPVAGGLLLAAGCAAPNHLLIEKAETEELEQRFDGVDDRLEDLAEAHEQSSQIAREAQLARIAGAMEAQTANRWLVPLRPVQMGDCDCPDEPNCPDDQLRADQELSADGMLVFGEIEPLQLDPPGLLFDARIDTGATTSSVDAREIEEFERDGDPWVRFEMVNPEEDEGRIAIERPKVRSASIAQASGEESRPVVELQVTIGEYSEAAEFTLTDRSHLTYPVLIGRDVLRDVAVVDVGLERATEPVTPDDEDLDAIDADDHVEEIVEDDEDAEDNGDDDDNDEEEDDNDTDDAEEEGDDDDENGDD